MQIQSWYDGSNAKQLLCSLYSIIKLQLYIITQMETPLYIWLTFAIRHRSVEFYLGPGDKNCLVNIVNF